MSDLRLQAVRNNADWCARICALHGSAGQFGDAAWVCDQPAPPYYPNVVTLRPDRVAAQTAVVQSLADAPYDLGVKDSFHALDLAPQGFRAAIQGRWLHYRDASDGDAGLDWRTITSPADLASWEAAWGGEAHRGRLRIFRPGLLADETVTVFGGHAAETLVAGGVINRAAEVVGLSNIFADDPAQRAGVLGHAHRLAGGGPLVGWEANDAEPDGEVLGPLQVWLRARPARPGRR
jgi:hypothetical protein